MPQYPFEFAAKADLSGMVSLDKKFTLPFNLKIRSLKLQTDSNCDDRIHTLKVFVNNSETGSIVDKPDEKIIDCTEYVLPMEYEIDAQSGEYDVFISTDGFSPSEDILVKGMLSYGFGLTIADIEGLREVSS
jgi:hypothetical protein